MEQLSNTEFLAKLESHPELLEHFKRLLLIVDGTGENEIRRADAAEEAVTTELRSLGKDVLSDWASIQEIQSANNLKSSMNGIKLHSKKNSTGAQVTVKSK